MWQAGAALAACVLLVGTAHAQDAQFWVLTDRGNVFLIEGPPPARPPGFDNSPFVNLEGLDTVLSLTAEGVPGFADPVAIMGDAGTVTPLPDYHPRRDWMVSTIVRDWGSNLDSRPLHAPMPVGDLVLHHGIPYLGPAKINKTAVDLLEHCNAGPVDPDGNGTTYDGTITVTCADNHNGRDVNATHVRDYGHVLDVRSHGGRTIVHVDNALLTPPSATPPSTPIPFIAEVVYSCPWCTSDAWAFHGVGGGAFMERGFAIPAALSVTVPTQPTPYSFWHLGLRGLAWDWVEDTSNNNVRYWQDGGACDPALSISGGQIVGACIPPPPHTPPPIQAGTVQASTWQPLTPGWNSVVFPQGESYIIIANPRSGNPGHGAQMQIREGSTDGCCTGFDGSIRNKAGKTAVIHDTDRHLLIIPPGGTVANDHPTLAEMQAIRQETAEQPQNTMRWLTHSDPPAPGMPDPTYNGIFYGDGGAWPPYNTRLVEARSMNFKLPSEGGGQYILSANYANYTQDDMRRILNIATPNGPLMDSEIYDIRNDKRLRTDRGDFKLWDGTTYDRPYIQPWLNLQKNPVWETYGVHLPENKLAVVDVYATFPMVKPTHISNTYLSSIPCGLPHPDEVAGRPDDPKLRGPLRDAMLKAAQVGGYDQNLIEFLLFADGDGDITQNILLQHIYKASRTYLDYLDGSYLAGDTIHVPILGNRPFLCVTIAPNILESQYNLHEIPYDGSYLQLGGREGTAVAKTIIPTTDDILFGEGWAATYSLNTGVQSPRDGVVALDVSASFSASVSAFGMGEAGTYTTHNMTQQWANGTILVDADLTVGETTVTMGGFAIDTHQIFPGNEHKSEDGTCYVRFETDLDKSPYITRTVTTAAKFGEHIPIVLKLTATEDHSVVGAGPFTGSSSPSLAIPDHSTRSDTLTMTETGRITGGSMTVTMAGLGDVQSITSCGTRNGGTEVSVETPSGNTHALPRPSCPPPTPVVTYDLSSLVVGEEMNGDWEIHLVDSGGDSTGTATMTDWELEFTRAASLDVKPICDATQFESIVVQFLLNTFVVDVR